MNIMQSLFGTNKDDTKQSYAIAQEFERAREENELLERVFFGVPKPTKRIIKRVRIHEPGDVREWFILTKRDYDDAMHGRLFLPVFENWPKQLRRIEEGPSYYGTHVLSAIGAGGHIIYQAFNTPCVIEYVDPDDEPYDFDAAPGDEMATSAMGGGRNE